MPTEARQVGIILVILGLIVLGRSVRFVESEEETTVRKKRFKRRLTTGYRVRIRSWVFWTGLILMVLGAALQW